MQINNDLSNIVVSATQPVNKNKVWLQYTGNIYDVNNITDQAYISSSSGAVTSVSSWCISNYMEVVPGEKITINGNTSSTAGVGVYGIYYDSSKNVVSSITYADYKVNGTILTIPNGVSYVRLSVPITEKNNFRVYVQDKEYILNSNGIYEEFNSQNDVYSVTEQRIGTWIDGKPLYRKVVSITVPTVTTQGTPVNATKSIADNIDNAFVEFGYIVFNSSNWTLPATLDEYYTNTYISSSKELVIRSALTVFNGATAYVSVKYTKTTD